MQLNRSTLLRTATAAVGAAALAGGLAVATIPAHASTPTVNTSLEVCNFLSSNVAIDLWDSKGFITKVGKGQCTSFVLNNLPLSTSIQLFLDNEGVEINQLIFVNKDPITEDVTGTASDVHQGITIN